MNLKVAQGADIVEVIKHEAFVALKFLRLSLLINIIVIGIGLDSVLVCVVDHFKD